MDTFSFNTIEAFDNHIKASIPALETLEEIIINLSTYFIKDYSTVIDLGCSTGRLLKKLKTKKSDALYIGYDTSTNLASQLNGVNIEIKDIIDHFFMPPKDCSFAISAFTLQFLPISSRLVLLRKLSSAMSPGAGLVVAEKVYQDNGFMEEVFSMSHYDFKIKSFTVEDIYNKQFDLRKIMRPLTSTENEKMFLDAGFSFTPIWQALNFKAWLLIPSNV